VTKWEYSINPLIGKADFTDLVDQLNYVAGREKFLNHMGEDGWELVAVDHYGIGYFKRPILDPDEVIP